MNQRIAVPLYTTIGFTVVMAVAGVTFAPADAWPSVLVAGFFLTGIGLAGGFVVAVHDASGGRWLGAMRRIACSLTRLVLPGSVISLMAIVFGGTELYLAFDHDAHLAGFKGWWLERTFFTVRAVAYVVSWMFALALLRRRRGAALFLVIFAFTISLATFDWVMALEPHWASTILPVYHFSGMVTAAMAVIAIVAVKQSRTDERVTGDHIHDAAKLLFAFSTFWMYIWFSQGMLIWYGNIPEEAAHYAVRAYGNWGVLFWTVVIVKWGLPFVVLLSEAAKRNRTIVSRIAVAVLIAHWLDLYVSIVPSLHAEPVLSGWELAIGFGAFAAIGWAVTRREREIETMQAPAVAPATARVFS